MKLLSSNGLVLEVRDVGPVLMGFKSRRNGPPLKHNGVRLVEDAEARSVVRELIDSRLYDRTEVR